MEPERPLDLSMIARAEAEAEGGNPVRLSPISSPNSTIAPPFCSSPLKVSLIVTKCFVRPSVGRLVGRLVGRSVRHAQVGKHAFLPLPTTRPRLPYRVSGLV